MVLFHASCLGTLSHHKSESQDSEERLESLVSDHCAVPPESDGSGPSVSLRAVFWRGDDGTFRRRRFEVLGELGT